MALCREWVERNKDPFTNITYLIVEREPGGTEAISWSLVRSWTPNNLSMRVSLNSYTNIQLLWHISQAFSLFISSISPNNLRLLTVVILKI